MTLHNDIDKIFKDGLHGYSQKPPGFVWTNIENTLNRQRFKRRRNILYSIAASVAIVLSFGAGYLLTNKPVEQLAQTQNFENKIIYNNNVEHVNNNNNINTAKTNDVKPSKVEKQLPAVDNKTKQPKPKADLSNKSAQTIVPEQPAQVDEVENNNQPNIKKANSSGTLLPPMFASNNTYNKAPVFEQQSKTCNNELTVNQMQVRSVVLKTNNEPKSINYDNRLLELYKNDLLYYDNANATKKASWSVAVNATPLLSYRDVYDVNKGSLMKSDNLSSLEQQYKNEKPLVSYSAGVDVAYGVSSRWDVQSGIYFSETGQISENIDLYTSGTYSVPQEGYYMVNTSSGNINIKGSQNEIIKVFSGANNQVDQNLPTVPGLYESKQTPDLQTDFIQTFEFYELPVVVNYKIIDKKIKLKLSGGLSANYMYRSKAYIKEDGKRFNLDAEIEDINTVGCNGIFGIGMQYPLVNNLMFNLQPTLRYSLRSINTDGTVYPYSLGVYSGLRYNF